MYESGKHVNSGNRVHYCRSLGGVPLDTAYSVTQAPLEAVDNHRTGHCSGTGSGCRPVQCGGCNLCCSLLGQRADRHCVQSRL